MKHIGLFEGIGGFSYAAKMMGWETVAWCEINPFGQQVLKHYYPDAEGFGDITKTDFTKYANKIDILTGGFPCQPYSLAGKRKGKEDERHLWPEMLRAIKEIQPRWVVGENVFGLINWSGGLVFHEVQADLEAAGYEVWAYVLPACAVNAPHRRDRVWFVAKNTNSNGRGSNKRQEKSGIGQFGNTCTRDNERIPTNDGEVRTITDTNLSGCEGEGEQHITKREKGNCSNGRCRNVANTEINGSQGQRKAGIFGEIERNIAAICVNEGGSKQTHCNSNCKRCNKSFIVSEPSKQRFGSRLCDAGQPSSWGNFPTQPPVRGRNDGIPTQLSGITVSKHRNESIKAYGNAIVPQVALQIFQAIEDYENLNQ